MFVTRKVEFSASHVCRVESSSAEENKRLYGEGANPNGHGHNYVCEVTVQGDPDPVSGMVIDLSVLKGILQEEVVNPMDHRFLNYEVKPFDRIVPTAENVASEIWRRLQPRLDGPHMSLARVKLFETPDLYVEITNGDLAL